MFGYNRFWHFIFRLDSRHYFRTVNAALTSSAKKSVQELEDARTSLTIGRRG